MTMNQQEVIDYIQSRSNTCTDSDHRWEWRRLIPRIKQDGLEVQQQDWLLWLKNTEGDTTPQVLRMQQNIHELQEAIEGGPLTATALLRTRVYAEIHLLQEQPMKELEVFYLRQLHAFLLEVEEYSAVLQDYEWVEDEIKVKLEKIALRYGEWVQDVLEQEEG